MLDETDDGERSLIMTDGIDKLKEFYYRTERASTLLDYIEEGKSNNDFYLRFEKETSAMTMTCMSSSYAMQRLLNSKPLSILVTSGTLSPVDTIKE